MTDIAEKLSAEGISLNRYTAGNQKIVCPKCSHGRRNKGEPCLSVKIDGDGARVELPSLPMVRWHERG